MAHLKMLLTPTYHVFEMYKGHQNARQLESYAETTLIGEADGYKVPDLHISASQASDGKVLVTVANLDDKNAAPLDCALSGLGTIGGVTGRVLSGARDAYNTFDHPEQIKPTGLENITLTAEGFKTVLPACSDTAFEVTAK